MIKVMKTKDRTQERGTTPRRRSIDDFVRPSGVASAVEDFVCGTWMGLNWPTTKWYEMNWEMPYILKNAGGYNTCEHIAKKYRLDRQAGLKSVTEASGAVNVGYHLGWTGYVALTATSVVAGFFYPPAFLAAPPVVRGIRSLVQGTVSAIVSPFRRKEG